MKEDKKMTQQKTKLSLFIVFLVLGFYSMAHAEVLKPFVLGMTPQGSMADVVEYTKAQLTEQGFTIVGSYEPYANATVIAASHPELTAASSTNAYGGFGAAQRVAVTEVNGKLQTSYVNPAYIGTAYGLGRLESISKKLEAALGREQEFGAKGIKEEKLAPGKYHYKIMMPYFEDIHRLNTFKDYDIAVQTVEANLAAGKGGTKKVYRIDLPDKDISVFGVAIPQGDGPNDGRKDTDKEIMDIIDYKDLRSTAYLPYEIMVKGNEVIALESRFRIAVHFPDTSMMGKHGFTAIMSSTKGIKEALQAVAGKE
jgi:hypothetical protein